ncbi:ABC transporter permease [Campylobacter sp. MIT 21-1685]|uniref:ABC transporter permease n=1 Tax=unclassified Campylobacter TaxID=2593542 RepID=UPI00224AE313|nr:MULTISPECIES: ABC transporter permease [unclassified Campylobacter]MCX2682673.1 ABC transporter permease [Campylobacter sp. MIT 21-1684]MCX2750953.1 ABC transporter permease [Campylobacter sp. MIT 21-1682]MCX2807114.1 ABC transporter permease [Campylobacter sp. MIT 21-1685]
MSIRFFFILGPCFLLILLALLAPVIAPFSVNATDLNALHLAPNGKQILGTDFFGRDLFSRLLFALRNSLFIGIASSFLTLLFACAYVLLARLCFYSFFMRILDLCLALPFLLLLMFFQSFFESSALKMIVLIALAHWSFVAKVVESEMKKNENLDFYKAALVLGASKTKLFFKDLLPSCLSLLFVLFLFHIVHSINTEATLSFFGLGLGFEIPSLGTLLSDSQRAVFIGAWWMILFPLLILLILILPLLWLANSLQKIWGMRV